MSAYTPTSALSPSDTPTNPTSAPSTYNGDGESGNPSGEAESSRMAEQTV
jgi:hypothetical protein